MGLLGKCIQCKLHAGTGRRVSSLEGCSCVAENRVKELPCTLQCRLVHFQQPRLDKVLAVLRKRPLCTEWPTSLEQKGDGGRPRGWCFQVGVLRVLPIPLARRKDQPGAMAHGFRRCGEAVVGRCASQWLNHDE